MEEHDNNDESFIYENNSLFKDMKDQSSLVDVNLNLSGANLVEPVCSVSSNEESIELVSKIKKSMINLKILKNMNNTFMAGQGHGLENPGNKSQDKNIFQVHHMQNNNQQNSNINTSNNTFLFKNINNGNSLNLKEKDKISHIKENQKEQINNFNMTFTALSNSTTKFKQ